MFIVISCLYLLILVAGAVAVFRWQRKHGRSRAWLASGLAVITALLLLPIPIHAGFTFLAEILVHELKDEWRQAEVVQKDERKAAFAAKLAGRFRGRLPLPMTEQAGVHWRTFPRGGSGRGWYDPGSGLIWTDVLALEGGIAPGLEQVRAVCGKQEPPGFWALPTEAELSLFWKAGGYDVSPQGSFGLVGLLEDADLQTELLTLQRGRDGSYGVRCVALGPAAPLSGYAQKDIPLADWNRYQLRKMTPGSS
jgi:hypothetical protein